VTIPFGDAPGELGLVTDVRRTSGIPYLPRSFAIDPDGTIWILDVVKKRLAHYTTEGGYLGQIEGFAFDRFSPHPRDVVFSNGRLFVLEEDRLKGILVTIDASGRLHRTFAYDHGVEVVLLLLYGAESGVSGLVSGYALEAGAGPQGVAGFDPPGSGEARFWSGVQVDRARWVDLRLRDDADLDVTFTASEAASIRPIHLKAVTRPGPGGRDVGIVTVSRIEASVDGGVVVFVRLSPARPDDAERYGGGAWLLRIGTDKGALLWERLPAPEISDEEQVRHLATGPDGHLYLMVPTKEGEAIYVK
jgi:hypothetical protein